MIALHHAQQGVIRMNTSFEVSVAAKKKYFSRRKVDLVSCHNALSISDFAFLQNIGHQLSGNGTSFGFDRLSEIGVQLETAAKEKNLKFCIELIEQLAKSLDEIGQNPIFNESTEV